MNYNTTITNNLSSYFDHTLLKPEATEREIERICEQAIKYNFYSVCVPPCYVSFALKRLEDSDTIVCTVIGFPLGMNDREVKIFEARHMLESGASELDLVMNIGKFLNKNYDYVKAEINDIKNICSKSKAKLKVIIETALLAADQIEKAAELVFDAGADYVKTSTGFSKRGASLNDIRILRTVANRYNGLVKAAGGIRDFDTTYRMILEGSDRIGSSSSVLIMEEAVRLLS